MFILDSNRYGRDSAGVSNQLTALIEKHGGTVLVSRLWEERRLAYPIAGQRKGSYWLIYMNLDSLNLTALERDCQLNENILRQLVLKIDPRIVDALVEHAQSGPTEHPRPRRPEPTPVTSPELAVPEDLGN
jgi:small subunit ribosomal protein S6